MKAKDRILVLNVDRDNDIGEKASVKGPVVGRENVLKAGEALGLADPECSDFNAIFQAVRVYDDMRKQYETEIAIIAGDKNVGVKSDRIIGEQLKAILGKFQANFVVLVTDGSEDERVMPVIQSIIPILSVKRVVVKQADELQSIYFKVKDFLHETLEDPKTSRLLFGLPAVVILIYVLFGSEGWRLILFAVGSYLFLRGFRLDRYVLGMMSEFVNSFHQRRFAFFGYVVGMAFAVLATYRGYFGALEWAGYGIFETAAGFASDSVFLYFMGGTAAWISRNVSVRKRKAGKIAAMPLFAFAVAIVAYSASQVLLKQDPTGFNFIASIVAGFVLLLAAVILEWKK